MTIKNLRCTLVFVMLIFSFFGYAQSPYTSTQLPKTTGLRNKKDIGYTRDTIAFILPFTDVESKGYGPSSEKEDALLSQRSSQLLLNITDNYFSPRLKFKTVDPGAQGKVINREVTKMLKHFFEKRHKKYEVSDSLNHILKSYGKKYVLIEDLEWLYNTKEFQRSEIIIHFTNFNREIRHYNIVGTESKFNFFIINTESKELVYYKFSTWWREDAFTPDEPTLRSHFKEAMWLFYNGLPQK